MVLVAKIHTDALIGENEVKKNSNWHSAQNGQSRPMQKHNDENDGYYARQLTSMSS